MSQTRSGCSVATLRASRRPPRSSAAGSNAPRSSAARGRILLISALLAGVLAAVPLFPAPAAAATVTRLAGADRAATAAALAEATTDAPSVIHLVAGTHFADALAAGTAAAAEDGVVALLDPSGVPAATRSLLAAHPDARVTIVGGTGRLPAALDGAVATAHGADPVRLAGADRFATAAKLAARAHPGGADTVWIASGRSAADALAAGAAAAAQDAPLLLTEAGRLPAATRDALVDLAPDEVRVAGGDVAVSDSVLDAARSLPGRPQVTRIHGDDRYGTATRIAATAFRDPDDAVLATGTDWVDALAATPLAAARNAPVLLVPRRCVPPATAAALDGVARVVVAGGPVAVSPRVDDLTACSEEIVPVTTSELGASWRPGCPVGPADLRRVTVDHRRLSDGRVIDGELIVHADVARDLVATFERLLVDGFRIHRVANVAEYGADDDRAMAADATTAFNCRTVAGTSSWSEHAYGTAIDLNPVENPYVSSGGSVYPPAGRTFTDRRDVRPGMVVAGGAADRAFTAIGWGWGGRWSGSRDYQHFSRSGR